MRAFSLPSPAAAVATGRPPLAPAAALQAASAAVKLRETSASEVKTPRRRQPPVGPGSATDQHALLLAGERFEGDWRKGEK